MKRCLSCIFIAMIFFPACKLEEIEFLNFRSRLVVTPEPGYFVRHDMVQNSNGEFLIAGATRDTQVLLMKVAPEGGLFSTSPAGPGSGHAIIRATGEDERYILLGNHGKDCFVALVHRSGQIQGARMFLKAAANAQLGLVDIVQGYDIKARPNGGYLITGYITQTIANSSRLCVIQLDENLQFITAKRYNAGVRGTCIATEPDGHFVVSGIEGGNAFIAKFSPDLVLLRGRMLMSSSPRSSTAVIRNNEGEFLMPVASPSASNSIDLAVYSNDLVSRIDITFPVTSNAVKSDVYDIAQTRDGGFLLLGFCQLEADGNNVFMLKINNENQQEWAEIYLSADEEVYPISAFQTEDFGLSALSIANDGMKNDFFLLKTDEIGKTR